MQRISFLFLIGLSALALFGQSQPEFSLEPVAPGLHDIVLHARGEAAFAAFVSEYGLSVRVSSDPLGPWYVLIENAGSKPIIGITTRYAVLGQDPKAGLMTTEHDTINNPHAAELPPHSRMLVSPNGTWIKENPISQNAIVGAATGGPDPKWYSSQPGITFSVDSALFADGAFAGPDSAHSYWIYDAFVTARRTMGSKLKTMRDAGLDAVTQYLDEQSTKSPDLKIPVGLNPTPESYLAWEMYRLARSRRATLKGQGLDALLARSEADLTWAKAFHLAR